MPRVTVLTSKIMEGDEFHGPNGVHYWTAVEPAYFASGESHVQVQHWPDGGIGPERVWTGELPIVVERADAAADPETCQIGH